MGFGKDGKGVIIRESKSQSVGTLATKTALLIGTKIAILEWFRIIKAELTATIIGVTTGEMTGMWIGIADGQWNVAEIKEALEANGPVGPNDVLKEELSDRAVWLLGAVDREIGTEAIFENEEGGHTIEKTLRWTFARTKSWNWFLWNQGSAPTGGATVQMNSKSFGVWVL